MFVDAVPEPAGFLNPSSTPLVKLPQRARTLDWPGSSGWSRPDTLRSLTTLAERPAAVSSRGPKASAAP